MTTLSLVKDGVLQQDITDLYDGGWLSIQIAPSSPAGPYQLTIADARGGRSDGQIPEPLLYFNTASGFDISPDELAILREGAAYYYTIWRYADQRWAPMALGMIRKQLAIRPVGIPNSLIFEGSALTFDGSFMTFS